MKIEITHKTSGTKFRELRAGDVFVIETSSFTWDKGPYMKINNCGDGDFINLRNNSILRWETKKEYDDTTVKKLRVKLVDDED